jgi:L-threonylcarbamoyladenylate synthase
VSVYLDGGPCVDNIPSTILDLTGTIPKVLRAGAISVDRLRAVASVIVENEHYAENAGTSADGIPADRSAADRSAADFKPAAPHPLQASGGSLDPAAGEPPSGA